MGGVYGQGFLLMLLTFFCLHPPTQSQLFQELMITWNFLFITAYQGAWSNVPYLKQLYKLALMRLKKILGAKIRGSVKWFRVSHIKAHFRN